MNIGILASGNLGLATIIEIATLLTPQFIATDKGSENIIKYAEEQNISLFIGNPRNGRLFNFLLNHEVEVLFSINYLFLIESDVLNLVKYPINFHGSLLPKFRGRTPHVWAIINNETTAGVTAHIIDQGCDTGDIVLQENIQIKPNSTGESLLEEFKALYPKMISEILGALDKGRLVLTRQDNSKATFFGKRTPDDGQINWAWQKERIYNWVRAQTSPYPGAFTFIDDRKIIIDSITFNELGFDDNMPNGLILANDPLILVKTPNGVIELSSIRENKHHCIKNKIFNYENK